MGPVMRGAQVRTGSLHWWRLFLLGMTIRPYPECLVPSLDSNSYHFHRKRAGARRLRRYLRRNPQRLP